MVGFRTRKDTPKKMDFYTYLPWNFCCNILSPCEYQKLNYSFFQIAGITGGDFIANYLHATLY